MGKPIKATHSGSTITPIPHPASFESIPGHSKPRSSSGVFDEKQQPGQELGQTDDFIRQIIRENMAGTNDTGYMIPYKSAKIYSGKSEWFVHFHYYSLTDRKYIRKKVRIHAKGLSEKDRMVRLQKVCAGINTIIRQRNKQNIYHEQVVQPAYAPSKTFYEYLVEFDTDATLIKSTASTVKTTLYNYELFLEAYPNFKTISPTAVTDKALIQFIKFLQDSGKVGKTINMYIWAIQLLLDKLLSEKVIPGKIETKRFRVRQHKNETEKYRPLTHAEKEKVFNYLRDADPGFYLYVLHVYYTCIRPVELRRLKVANVKFQQKTIHVPGYSSKNGLSANVQILTPLKDAINDAKISKCNKGFFLFSQGFIPGETQYKGKYDSDKWRLVCKKLSIDDSAMLYGLKHTFNIDYVENNRDKIDWEWLRCHNRHATIQQTQDYIRSLSPYMLDEAKNTILNYHNSDTAKQ